MRAINRATVPTVMQPWGHFRYLFKRLLRSSSIRHPHHNLTWESLKPPWTTTRISPNHVFSLFPLRRSNHRTSPLCEPSAARLTSSCGSWTASCCSSRGGSIPWRSTRRRTATRRPGRSLWSSWRPETSWAACRCCLLCLVCSSSKYHVVHCLIDVIELLDLNTTYCIRVHFQFLSWNYNNDL